MILDNLSPLNSLKMISKDGFRVSAGVGEPRCPLPEGTLWMEETWNVPLDVQPGTKFCSFLSGNEHNGGISGAQLRFKLRLYSPICKSLPMRNYLCYPKWMQDLENAGFKLFTQMHRGQQKGWKKYQRAGCCTVIHCSYGEIWNSLFLSSKWNPVLFFPLSHFCWQYSGFFY